MNLTSLLKIRPEEGRLVLLVALLFALVQGGQGFGDNAASALFLLRFGVDFLPYMYMLLGALTFLTTMAYSAGLSRYARGRFFSTLVLGLILLLIVERLALFLDMPILYPVVWLTINGLGMILGTLTWNIAGEVTDARQAKRLFPIFASAGILGSVLGNLVTGVAAASLGTVNLLLIHAVVLAVAYYFIRLISTDFFRPASPAAARSSFLSDLSAGFDYVRRSQLMRLTALASILLSVLFFSIAFPFNKVVSTSFTNEAQVAGFFGLFNSLTTLATFLISLFVANRLYSRIGIVNSVLLMPLTYMLGFIVFASAFSLSGAVMARSLQLVILSGLAGTAWNALFNVVPSQKRSRVLAFNNGVPAQVGVALSGLLLILGERILSTTQIFLMGILVTALCGVLIWRMRSAYGQALVDALRLGRMEVFASDLPAFSGLKDDAAAFEVVRRLLHDPKATTRRLAAEITGRMQNPAAVADLEMIITDRSAEVRAAAIRSLGQIGSHEVSIRIIPCLNDPDTDVRLQTLLALTKMEPDASANLIDTLVPLMDDRSNEVRQAAVVLLVGLDRRDIVQDKLTTWLKSEDISRRASALGSLAQFSSAVGQIVDVDLILPSLSDPSLELRRAACHALSSFPGEKAPEALVGLLADPDPSVREAASSVLRLHFPQSQARILDVLRSPNSLARDAALDALTPGDPEIAGSLREHAHSEVERLRLLRSSAASLSKGISINETNSAHRGLEYLVEILGDDIRLSENRLVKMVGLIGNPQTMELVRKSISHESTETRAAALETLETLGDKQLSARIISILEEQPVLSSPALVLAGLIKDGSHWQRLLAIQAVQELELRELVPDIKEQVKRGDEFARQISNQVLQHFGEVAMETLNTVSTIERVLLLRDVPIFAHLPPEDLERLAQIAGEQWFPASTYLYRQGDPGNELCIIISGRINVVNETASGQRPLAQRGPGDFVGEMAILDSQPRMASLIAEDDVRGLTISGDAFKGILRERPSVALAVMQSLSSRLREVSA
jgi:HEAT repeat protein